jgi:hypothetical protein
MNPSVPIVQNRRATRSFMAEVNGLRVTATQPFLGATAEIVDEHGRPLRTLITVLNSLASKAPVASQPIADPQTGRPTREFIRLMAS